MVSAVYWSIGDRENNEDSLSLQEHYYRGHYVTLALVADGIGSLEEGETASRMVALEWTHWFEKNYKRIALQGLHNFEIRMQLRKRMREIERKLKSYARTKRITMGTTCSMVLIRDRQVLTLQVGDSEIRMICRGRTKRISGLHKDEQGRLTECVGGRKLCQPTVRFFFRPPGHGILVCSDGFAVGLPGKEEGRIAPGTDKERWLQTIGRRSSLVTGDNRSAILLMDR